MLPLSKRVSETQKDTPLDLYDLIRRTPIPEPWAEGENIPWNEAGFSSRMLLEHLSQEHDAASRRFPIVEQHIEWIHRELLQGQPTSILDLGCGPGLYTTRLARLGHTCTGIDFSPASIRYAQQQAEKEQLACAYHLGDLRAVDFGLGRGDRAYGLVMLIFGEFNVFKPEHASAILEKASRALQIGGRLLLEPHPFSTVQKLGQSPPAWHSAESGLYSDRPYLYLEESFWDAARRAATNRYWVIDAGTAQVSRYASSYQAYSNAEYHSLLERIGFTEIEFYPSLSGRPGEPETDLIAITARKPPVGG
jgi:ubiquinone/menaquinone biosynthesis C-methylase UbiE